MDKRIQRIFGKFMKYFKVTMSTLSTPKRFFNLQQLKLIDVIFIDRPVFEVCLNYY